MNVKLISAALATCTLAASSGAFAAGDQWEHSIGTGLFGLNIKGDLGINIAGKALEIDNAELDSSQIRDYTKSAFGFGGASSKGDWKIAYAYSNLNLEDKNNSSFNGTPVSAKLTFDATNAYLASIYTFARNSTGHWGALGGLRYYSQELEAKATVAATTERLKRDESWTDVLVGITHALPLSKEVVWHSQLDLGIGDGHSRHATTGIAWRFAKSWTADFYADYKHYDYENGNRNSANWYLYDAAEYGVGASILYNF